MYDINRGTVLDTFITVESGRVQKGLVFVARGEPRLRFLYEWIGGVCRRSLSTLIERGFLIQRQENDLVWSSCYEGIWITFFLRSAFLTRLKRGALVSSHG